MSTVSYPTIPVPIHAPGFCVEFVPSASHSYLDNPREVWADGTTIYFELYTCPWKCSDCEKGQKEIISKLEAAHQQFQVVTFGRRPSRFGKDLWLVLPQEGPDPVEQVVKLTGFELADITNWRTMAETDKWLQARRPLWKKVFLFWKKTRRAWEVSRYDHHPWNKILPE